MWWLLVLPLLSLVVVYLALFLLDQNISRATFTVLAVVSLLLPVVVLGYGLQSVFRPHSPAFTPIAAAVSSLFWVIVAGIANTALPTEEPYTIEQSIVTALFYFVSVTVILYAVQLAQVSLRKGKKA